MATVASRAELERLLEDDVPYGDLTTEALGIGMAEGVMQFAARTPMVLALAEDAAAIIALAGCEVELFAASGAVLEQGAPILKARGPAASLLRSWKVAQTMIEVWSGVASETRAIVDAARAIAPRIPVACTRKNAPGTKRFGMERRKIPPLSEKEKSKRRSDLYSVCGSHLKIFTLRKRSTHPAGR